MTDELSPAEVAEVTGKTRPVSQAVVLARMGVPFVFLGRACKVERSVARAFALLPQGRAVVGGVDFSRVK